MKIQSYEVSNINRPAAKIDAPIPYPTIHPFVPEMCICEPISVLQNGALWQMFQTSVLMII